MSKQALRFGDRSVKHLATRPKAPLGMRKSQDFNNFWNKNHFKLTLMPYFIQTSVYMRCSCYSRARTPYSHPHQICRRQQKLASLLLYRYRWIGLWISSVFSSSSIEQCAAWQFPLVADSNGVDPIRMTNILNYQDFAMFWSSKSMIIIRRKNAIFSFETSYCV